MIAKKYTFEVKVEKCDIIIASVIEVKYQKAIKELECIINDIYGMKDYVAKLIKVEALEKLVVETPKPLGHLDPLF